MSRILLEDSWHAQDIVDYCSRNAIRCDVMSADALRKMNSTEFLQCAYFCNTATVQHHLRAVGREDLVPDTYEHAYSQFYNRSFSKSMFKDVDLSSGPKFVKPAENSKLFDGKVVQSLSDFDERPPEDCIVYSTTPVQFAAEYRLLIGNGKLYGCGHVRGARVDKDGLSEMANKIIATTAGANFRCVDVGLLADIKKLIVVEINPPFSLEDYAIPLSAYMSFCIDACAWLATML